MSVEQLVECVANVNDARIVLLRNKEVIMWLFGDLSFLSPIETTKNKQSDEAKYKQLEDAWGRDMLKKRRPDLKLEKQWTNMFGEHVSQEIFFLAGKHVKKPAKKERYQPDLELDDAIIEVKTGTFHTAGTAGEKILGAPFKYAEIPFLYGKPLRILCLGGAEKVCREQYGNLAGAKCSAQKQKILDFLKHENQTEYVGATDVLQQLLLANESIAPH